MNSRLKSPAIEGVPVCLRWPKSWDQSNSFAEAVLSLDHTQCLATTAGVREQGCFAQWTKNSLFGQGEHCDHPTPEKLPTPQRSQAVAPVSHFKARREDSKQSVEHLHCGSLAATAPLTSCRKRAGIT